MDHTKASLVALALGLAGMVATGRAATTPAPAARPPSGTPAAAPWDVLWLLDPPDGSPTQTRPAPGRLLRRLGDNVYAARCTRCHGEAGDGQGPLASQLRPHPADFTAAVYKVRSTPSGSLPTDRDLFRTLTRGFHDTGMQPWRRLTEQERWALVAKLQSFSPRFAREPAPKPIALPTPPRELDELREQGEILYIRQGCGGCHGDTGAGNGPVREQLRKQGRKDVRVRDFTRGRFIRGAEMEDIFLTLRTGLDGTAMAAYDKLSDDELWALAAYVRVLVRERPLDSLPAAGTEAELEHDPVSGSL
jgi:mono/diheme cytochrome c family protein